MNTLLNGLREFFVPLLPLYFEKLLNALVSFSQASQTAEGTLKRKRNEIDFNQDDEKNHSFYELLVLIVETLRLNFVYDNLTFI